MIIDHIGYAVKNIDKAMDEFKMFGFVFREIINDYDRNIKICFGINDNYCVELISPLLKSSPSPVDGYLSKVGPVAYHFCYRSENLEGDIKELKKEGFRMIIEPKISVAFSRAENECKRVCFFQGRNTGIFEIVEN